MNEEQRRRNDKSSQRPQPLRWCAYCWAYTPHVWRGRVYECLECEPKPKGTDMKGKNMDIESLREDLEAAFEEFDALDLVERGIKYAAEGSGVNPVSRKIRNRIANERIREIRLLCNMAEEAIEDDSIHLAKEPLFRHRDEEEP